MANVFGVAVCHRRQHLFDNGGRVFLSEMTTFSYFVEKFTASAQLGHKVEALLILEDLEQTHDVWVV